MHAAFKTTLVWLGGTQRSEQVVFAHQVILVPLLKHLQGVLHSCCFLCIGCSLLRRPWVQGVLARSACPNGRALWDIATNFL